MHPVAIPTATISATISGRVARHEGEVASLFEGNGERDRGIHHPMAEAIEVHAFDIDLDVHLRLLFAERIAVINSSEPATDADLFADLGDSVTVSGDGIGEGFGFFGIDAGAGASRGIEALGEVRVFMNEAREPALGDPEAVGDIGLGFAGFDTFEDTSIPSALRFDLLLNEGLQGARGHEGRVCTNWC